MARLVMNCHRFTAPGRLTNYEMAGIRTEPQPRRRIRWMYMWASVSDAFHPTSHFDWIMHNPE